MGFDKPLILINFKTYPAGTGNRADKIAEYCEIVNGKAQLAVAVQALDLFRIASTVKIPVFAQHMDTIGYGSNTGWVLPENVKESGAAGTLINHSEHRLDRKAIGETVKRAKEAGLISVVCARDAQEGAELAGFGPDYIAVEPPELIGDPKLSVSSARPGLIKESVEKIKCNVLVGAGVKSTEDVRVALSFGAKGVLVASDVMKAEDPLQALKKLAKGV